MTYFLSLSGFYANFAKFRTLYKKTIVDGGKTVSQEIEKFYFFRLKQDTRLLVNNWSLDK